MNDRRKKAYRYLLYHAMLDIRSIGWIEFTGLRILNPFFWQTTFQRMRRAGFIADWLHNLALFAALDFRDFDERTDPWVAPQVPRGKASGVSTGDIPGNF